MTAASIVEWRKDRSAVIDLICKNITPFKIVLKVKNDPVMLNDWIEYHVQYYGAGSVIVFDNCSDDPVMLEVLNRIAGRGITVVTFEGFHNNIHNTDIFRPLYDALDKSCEYFTFLDADERLTHVAEDMTSIPSRLVGSLRASPDTLVWPGTWLYNARGSRSIFRVGSGPQTLLDGLKWGKPIIKAGAFVSGFINHNTQLKQEFYRADNPTNVFVLHMANLSRAQRIQSNISKLKARKVVSSEEDLEALLRSDLTTTGDGNVRLYVNEIRRLRAMDDVVQTKLQQGDVAIDDAGSMQFYSAKERDLLLAHVGEAGRRLVKQMASA